MADTGEQLIQRCFAGGIPGNLTIDLSPITDILAISHQAPVADQGEPVEIKQVRREGAGRASGDATGRCKRAPLHLAEHRATEGLPGDPRSLPD